MTEQLAASSNPLHKLLYEFETYRWDLPLFAELGLQPFRGQNWSELFVGKVELKDLLIFIWVMGAPAQFWRFEIVDFGNYSTHTITTGSGALRDHWPHVLQVARGMLGVASVYWGPPLQGKKSVKSAASWEVSDTNLLPKPQA
jgi:hypothetical protein